MQDNQRSAFGGGDKPHFNTAPTVAIDHFRNAQEYVLIAVVDGTARIWASGDQTQAEQIYKQAATNLVLEPAE